MNTKRLVSFIKQNNKYGKKEAYLLQPKMNMSNVNDKGAERQAKLKDFLTPGAGVSELQSEIIRLREENLELKDQLAEREAHIQNLFSFIHNKG